MTASENKPLGDDLDVDALLAEAAGLAAPPLPGAFLDRLMADADQAQPPLPVPAPQRVPVPPGLGPAPLRGGILGGLFGGVIGALADALGGRGALAGMMLATAGGLYLGLAQPALLSNLTGMTGDTQIESLDLLSGSDSLWTETTP